MAEAWNPTHLLLHTSRTWMAGLKCPKERRLLLWKEVALPACPVEWIFIMLKILSWTRLWDPCKGRKMTGNFHQLCKLIPPLNTDTGANCPLLNCLKKKYRNYERGWNFNLSRFAFNSSGTCIISPRQWPCVSETHVSISWLSKIFRCMDSLLTEGPISSFHMFTHFAFQ